jgi:6-phosphogluconate dehydrogenase
MSTPEQTTKTAKIGMIGLGVMGENLARNIERNGYSIAVWNREPKKVDEFVGRLEGHQVIGAHTPEEFVKSLERPRKAILLVKAGDPVDWTVNQIKPFLEEGDIIIDGGNSYFMDTERREKE